jgi:hypothetical protein
MTLAELQALLVGQTVLYTPTGEVYSQIGTVTQNGPDVRLPPTAMILPNFPPSWLRIRLHDPGTGSDWQLDFALSGPIPSLSLPS